MPRKERKPMKQPATQKTPAGYEIPVPKRGQIMDALKKLARPTKK